MQKIRILEKWYLYFMLYSIIGWLYEVFLEVVVYQWGFSNRGVLFGPYCPIYGTGALIFIICLRKLKKRPIRIWKISITPILVFIGIVCITTLLELLGSYIMEITFGSWMWDYTTYAMNFQGRVALNPSLRFGLGGMIFMYLLQPLFEKLTNRLTNKILNIITIAVITCFVLDIIYTFIIK